ncbi:helix-turn-helix domain-containing protein [Streptomyces noursei]|uniref:helix-turn-helix domain-containing protein n=1 Tax=Streptomyces noursei TaxID=1971 RepID=UPI00045EFA19|nr:hypothetical protein DC74_5234 [Streptomyces noursei]
MARAELGGRLGYSASSLASYEQGRRIPPPRFIGRADEALRAGGVLTALKEEVARAQALTPRESMAFIEKRLGEG